MIITLLAKGVELGEFKARYQNGEYATISGITGEMPIDISG